MANDKLDKLWIEEELLPREKLSKYGRAQLKDFELFAILLDTGIKGKTVFELSKEILQLSGNHLEGLLGLELDTLKTIKGLGQAKSSKIIASVEIAQRILSEKTTTKPIFNNVQSLFDYSRSLFYGLQHEEFYLYCLNQKLELIRAIKIGEGGTASVGIDVKKLFREALSVPKMTSIIIAHNHPSGNNEASKADIQLTKKVITACEYLDIRFVDHIIVTTNDYFSFTENQLI